VTALAGVILIAIALFAPLGRLANAIPAAVVGGTAMVVFAIIGTMGIDMLRRVDLRGHGNMFVLASALTMGLLPILVPGMYSKFSPNLQILLGNGLAMGVLTAVLMNILFHHVGAKASSDETHGESKADPADTSNGPAVERARIAT